MKQDTANFIEHLIRENILTAADFEKILKNLGDDPELSSVAQEALNLKVSIVGEENAEPLLGIFESAMHSAAQTDRAPAPGQQASTPPPEKNETQPLGTYQDLTDFSAVQSMSDIQCKTFIRDMLTSLRKKKASDLHFSAKAQPFIRNSLRIERISDHVLTEEESKKLNTVFLNDDQHRIFEKNKGISFTITFSEKERYRTTLITHKDGIAATYHIVPDKINTLQELGFSPENIASIQKFLGYHNGLILVTGPVGSGKTTTLASLVDIINKQREDHIIMVENPIEIVQSSINCNVTQREVNRDTQSYARAIKAALREDPDIIVIGELSDLETIQIAITASETGHLVIGTMQTSDSINTLNRMVNSFPPFQQPQIKTMLAGSLRGIICQRLIQSKDERVALACELLVNNLAISNTIIEGKLHLIMPILQTGMKSGMCSMDGSIFSLFKNGAITEETAVSSMANPRNYQKQMDALKTGKSS